MNGIRGINGPEEQRFLEALERCAQTPERPGLRNNDLQYVAQMVLDRMQSKGFAAGLIHMIDVRDYEKTHRPDERYLSWGMEAITLENQLDTSLDTRRICYQVLRKALIGVDRQQRLWGVKWLPEYAPDRDKAVAILTELLSDKEPEVRSMAAVHLSHLDQHAPGLTAALVDALKDPWRTSHGREWVTGDSGQLSAAEALFHLGNPVESLDSIRREFGREFGWAQRGIPGEPTPVAVLPGWQGDLSPDGHYLATGTWDGKVHVWNVEERRLAIPPEEDSKTYPMGRQSPVQWLVFSPDGERLSVGADGKTVVYGGYRFGEYISQKSVDRQDPTDELDRDAIGNLHFALPAETRRVFSNPAGTFLAAVGLRGLVTIWDAKKGEEIRRMICQDVDRVKFCAGDRWLLTICPRSVRLFALVP